MMKFKFLYILLLFFNAGYSQYNKTRFPIGLFNKDSLTIIGIGTGLIASSDRYNKTIGLHLEIFGLSEMVIHPDPGEFGGPKSDSAVIADLRYARSPKRIYGINISGLGLFCRSCDLHGLSINGMASLTTRIYGVQVTGISSWAELMNGMQLSIVVNVSHVLNGLQISPGLNMVEFKSKGIQLGGFNKSGDHTGLQIGIVNKAVKLKGLQIGIWNTSGKRKLPLVNW